LADKVVFFVENRGKALYADWARTKARIASLQMEEPSLKCSKRLVFGF
jgi:hypothetical protein